MSLLAAVLAFTALLIGYIGACRLRRRWLGEHKKLPPGTMGWPFIGETLQLYSSNPNAFFASKQRRYGKIFKSHILGCPCVMIASPQAAKFVLSTRAELFKPTFPASKQKMIGQEALFFHEGPYHARLRRLVLRAFSTDSIRGLLPRMEQLVLCTLNSWDGKTVNTFVEMKEFSFKAVIHKICDNQGGLDMEDLSLAYSTLEKGYNCLPINIPGTKYYKALQARKHINGIITTVIRERKAALEKAGGGGEPAGEQDFIGRLLACQLEADQVGSHFDGLTEQQMVDNIIGLIFASRDTTASVITWLMKFLRSSPALLDSVIAEHESIRRAKLPQLRDCLTWEDTRKMHLTTRVIQETLRVATVLSFTFREAVEDVEYEGYLIPKGWKVLPLFKNIHHSPEFFPEPHKFDPSRFEVMTMSCLSAQFFAARCSVDVLSGCVFGDVRVSDLQSPIKPNTFLPFGNGMHSCPGNELAKLEMLVFIHHLATKFQWELDETKTGVQYSPFRVPQEGLPIRVERRH